MEPVTATGAKLVALASEKEVPGPVDHRAATLADVAGDPSLRCEGAAIADHHARLEVAAHHHVRREAAGAVVAAAAKTGGLGVTPSAGPAGATSDRRVSPRYQPATAAGEKARVLAATGAVALLEGPGYLSGLERPIADARVRTFPVAVVGA